MAPAFEYEAVDGGGRARKGVITAESPRLARSELRRLHLTPVALQPARESKKDDAARRTPARIGGGELPAVTRQLAVLIGAGAPLEEALSAIALETDRLGVRKRLLAVRERITEGWRFSDALQEDRLSFPELYVAIVAAGEASGDLSPALERLADMLEKSRKMRSKAVGALVYPAALFVFAGLVVSVLMVEVVPRIVEQFETFETELPLITRIVGGVSDFLAAYGLAILGAIFLSGIGLWQAMKRPRYKIVLDRLLLRIPLLRGLLRALDGARFARTLATLFGGGAPLLDSLSGAQRTVGNLDIRARLDTVIERVREGGGLARAIQRSGALPSMLGHMIAAGERSSALPELLDRAADQLEEEFDAASGAALKLLEPAIIILMGGMVMAIVAAIMLPILRLNSLAAL